MSNNIWAGANWTEGQMGKGNTNPGAVQVKDPWWKEYATKGIVATSGKLFDHLSTPTASKEVVGGQLTKDANTAFDTYGESLGDESFILDRMKRTGETEDQAKLWATKELGGLSERRKKLAEAYRTENSNHGKTVVDPRINNALFKPTLNPGYVYRSDLGKEEGEKGFSFFDTDTWKY